MKSFHAAAAKMDKMASELLCDEDFITLIQEEDFESLLGHLKKFPMGEEIEVTDSAYDAELKLQHYRRVQLQKLEHYYDGQYKSFVKAVLGQYEYETVKKVLRMLQVNKDDKESKQSLAREFAKLQIDPVTTIQTFVNELKHTKYYNVLQPYEDEKSSGVLFYMEMNLDKQYYQDLVKISKTFQQDEQRAIRALLGRKIDLYNIIWIYRGKKYYNLLPEELINFSIRGGAKFTFDDMRSLCYMDELEEFVASIRRTEYAFLFDGDRQEVYMHRRMGRYLHYLAKKDFVRATFGFEKFVAYFYLLDDTIKDITTLMETTRFGLDPAEKEKFLLRAHLSKGSEM